MHNERVAENNDLKERDGLQDFIAILKDAIREHACSQGNLSDFLDFLYNSEIDLFDIIRSDFDLKKIEVLPLSTCLLEFKFKKGDEVEVYFNTNHGSFRSQKFQFELLKEILDMYKNVVIRLEFDYAQIDLLNKLSMTIDYLKLSLKNKDVTFFAYETQAVIKELELRYNINKALDEGNKEDFMKYSKEFNEFIKTYTQPLGAK